MSNPNDIGEWFYYLGYHLPTKTKHYCRKRYLNRLNFLTALDNWNALGRGQWQYASCQPGFACPPEGSAKWETVG